MKRDKTLMVEILLRIELSERNEVYIDRDMEPEMIDSLYDHIKLLGQAGYITYNDQPADDQIHAIWVSLTNKGYDYLEEIEAKEQANKNLSRAKGILSKATNWTMTNVASPLLAEFTKSLIL
ncbi:DUF2513 domain-containing protein [Priestia megaterium]|uniref:DUF2513 domain-containing protein n=1 Tax=Priestia megaterium TaxID=1404 RepID=UPI001374AAFF|nr:DUF2513 domain-containing protein [Priestia megaterium]